MEEVIDSIDQVIPDITEYVGEEVPNEVIENWVIYINYRQK